MRRNGILGLIWARTFAAAVVAGSVRHRVLRLGHGEMDWRGL